MNNWINIIICNFIFLILVVINFFIIWYLSGSLKVCILWFDFNVYVYIEKKKIEIKMGLL